MAHFDSITIPKIIRLESTSVPHWPADQLFARGGDRQVNQQYSQHLALITVNFIKPNALIYDLYEIYNVLRGVVHSCNGRDWMDWNTTLTNNMKQGGDSAITHLDAPLINPNTGTSFSDHSTTVFQMHKAYSVGGQTYNRRIYKPEGLILIGHDGDNMSGISPEDYTVNLATGEVTFSDPPPFGNAVISK